VGEMASSNKQLHATMNEHAAGQTAILSKIHGAVSTNAPKSQGEQKIILNQHGNPISSANPPENASQKRQK
jgi:hypothetical protein